MDERIELEERPPPASLWGRFRYLGPGLIVTGSIVGSGELILTTSLGAQAGFTLLWLIILSCIVKVFLQIELGRYAISSGETTLDGFQRVPGPRLCVSWIVWCWFAMAIASVIQLSGILLYAAEPFVMLWRSTSLHLWTPSIALATMVLLSTGRYRIVELPTTIMVFLFTMASLLIGLSLQGTELYAIKGSDLMSGLRFAVPEREDWLNLAIGAFGVTGVGATELVWYPYWCMEKGYGKFAGPRREGPDWVERARGWIRVMQTDAWVSLVVYTSATVAFYFLGAAVLNRDFLAGRGEIPSNDKQSLETLGAIYTRTLGRSLGEAVFIVGAFAVLYSTFFVATASGARLFADFGRVVGWFRFRNEDHRRRCVAILCLLIPIFCWIVQFSFREPRTLILIGAIGQFCMLPFIALATVYLRYCHTDPRIRPSRVADSFLWVAFGFMSAFGIYKAIDELRKVFSA